VGTDYYAERVSVITGAGSGIGRALALDLAGRGAHLALWDRDGQTLADTAHRCREAGARVRTDIVDVSDRRAVLERSVAVHGEFGRVDLVFCVAGVIHTGTVLDSDVEDVEHVLNINFWGVVHTTRAFLPHVISSGVGHLVTMSSAVGLIALPRYSAYCASKFAVRGFTESLRQELATNGVPVAVSCVYPGGVRTPIVRHGRFATGEDPATAADRFDTRIARTTPEKAASVILRGVQHGRARILVGTDARFVSAVVRVTGGAYQGILPWLSKRTRAREER
jgi:short-subunit dehydrogenase